MRDACIFKVLSEREVARAVLCGTVIEVGERIFREIFAVRRFAVRLNCERKLCNVDREGERSILAGIGIIIVVGRGDIVLDSMYSRLFQLRNIGNIGDFYPRFAVNAEMPSILLLIDRSYKVDAVKYAMQLAVVCSCICVILDSFIWLQLQGDFCILNGVNGPLATGVDESDLVICIAQLFRRFQNIVAGKRLRSDGLSFAIHCKECDNIGGCMIEHRPARIVRLANGDILIEVRLRTENRGHIGNGDCYGSPCNREGERHRLPNIIH